jgi:hypothetical protein
VRPHPVMGASRKSNSRARGTGGEAVPVPGDPLATNAPSRDKWPLGSAPRSGNRARSAESSLALGGLVVVEAGGTTLAASALLGLVRPPFVLLRRLHELTRS